MENEIRDSGVKLELKNGVFIYGDLIVDRNDFYGTTYNASEHPRPPDRWNWQHRSTGESVDSAEADQAAENFNLQERERDMKNARELQWKSLLERIK